MNADGSVERGNRKSIQEAIDSAKFSISLARRMFPLFERTKLLFQNKGARILKKYIYIFFFFGKPSGGCGGQSIYFTFFLTSMTVGGRTKNKKGGKDIRRREKRLCEMDGVCVSISLYFLCRVTKGQFTKFWHLISPFVVLLPLSLLLLSAFNSVRSTTYSPQEKKRRLLLNPPRYWIQVASQLPVFSLPSFSFVSLSFFFLSSLLLFLKN